MVKVLIVEDSPVIRALLEYIINSDPELMVIGTVANGVDALEFISHNKPDVVTMDIYMPVMDGFVATRKIMETMPVPIIVVSSILKPDVASAMSALELGALAVVETPPGVGHHRHDKLAQKLIHKIKIMSEVKVVRHWAKKQSKIEAISSQDIQLAERDIKCVAIGASTGGPSVVRAIIAGLPDDFPAPVLIVQHIAQGFLEGMVEWLRKLTKHSIKIAQDGEKLLAGHIYFAPEGFHLGVDSGNRIALSRGKEGEILCPSVSKLFSAVSEVYRSHGLGILLTGMGSDGALELKHMLDKGAITIAQDKESSVVFGMPGEAIRLGGAKYVLPPEGIIAFLVKLSKSRGCFNFM